MNFAYIFCSITCSLYYPTVPGPVSTFEAQNVRTDEVSLIWTEPLQKNGAIQDYVIRYESTEEVGYYSHTGSMFISY